MSSPNHHLLTHSVLRVRGTRPQRIHGIFGQLKTKDQLSRVQDILKPQSKLFSAAMEGESYKQMKRRNCLKTCLHFIDRTAFQRRTERKQGRHWSSVVWTRDFRDKGPARRGKRRQREKGRRLVYRKEKWKRAIWDQRPRFHFCSAARWILHLRSHQVRTFCCVDWCVC